MNLFHQSNLTTGLVIKGLTASDVKNQTLVKALTENITLSTSFDSYGLL